MHVLARRDCVRAAVVCCCGVCLDVCGWVYLRVCAHARERLCVCVCRVGAMGESVVFGWESGGHNSKVLTGQDGVYVLALERSRQSPPGMTFV